MSKAAAKSGRDSESHIVQKRWDGEFGIYLWITSELAKIVHGRGNTLLRPSGVTLYAFCISTL
jgi:hypothetical protein